MSCLADTKSPGRKVSYMMTRLCPRCKLPRFQELAAKKWGKKTKTLKEDQIIVIMQSLSTVKGLQFFLKGYR